MPLSEALAPLLWRTTTADEAAMLVDADAYFRALHAALLRARHQILIIGWDVDSRLHLLRDERGPVPESQLWPLLNSIVGRPAGPEAFVLGWDFSSLYTFERQPLQSVVLVETSHPKLHFEQDGAHPVGASHHQKIVVIDDAIAFAGGLDLCFARWDTPQHLANDPRRVDPPRKPHGPMHDVQAVVTGEAAAALGDLARRRWRHATGVELDRPRERTARLTDIGVSVELTGVRVGIARTEPAFDGRAPVHELEASHLAALKSAKTTIFIENQFLTSSTYGAAIIESLAQPSGPEIVVVIPRKCSGWIEEATLGLRRDELLARLHASDPHGRLHLYVPQLDDRECVLNVHSKVTIVDDELLRIGSGNLTNRSFRMDTECDLLFFGETEAQREAISGARARLLAEHLGVSEAAVRARPPEHLSATIDALRGRGRTLVPFDEAHIAAPTTVMKPFTDIADPEEPHSVDPLVNRALSDAPPPKRRTRAVVVGVLALVVTLALAGMWTFTPLRQWASPEALRALVGPVVRGPLGALIGLAGFVALALAFAPLILLIVATSLLFPAPIAIAIDLAGTLLAASAQYGIGRALGSDLLARILGRERMKATASLRGRGVLAMAMLRNLPVAPFSVVNLATGAAKVPFLVLFGGTALGITPGVLALTLLGKSLGALIPAPGAALVVAVVAGAVLAMVVGRLVVRSRRRRESSPAHTTAELEVHT